MKPVWAWFGYDEPNYTYMKDGRKLLSELAALSPVPVYVRTHNLMTTGDGTPSLKWGSTNMYTEDASGNPIYNWRIADSIFDTYIKRGMKPLAQIGFMPKALSTHPEPYQHDWKPGLPYDRIITGWAYPPKDYTKWEELVYQWVAHCVAKWGQTEVESWYWEVWNEPDGAYWKGTQAELFKLYDYAAAGVKKALPTARIGGADVTGGGSKFLDAFLQHCLRDTNYATGTIGSPLDVVLFHAKGQPKVINGEVTMNMGVQLRNIRDNLVIINKYPELKNTPVVIGECDPEGCAACGMATNPENAYRNGTMYSSYTAASFARIYALSDALNKNLSGAVSWSFEFENQPPFAGFRDLATNGIDKPVLNVFRMYGMMNGDRVAAQSNRMYDLQTVVDSSIRNETTDVGVLAAKDKHSATIMLWNYGDKDESGDAASVDVTIAGLPSSPITVTRYIIDKDHSNAYEAWKKAGSPQSLTDTQVKALQAAGQLQRSGKPERLQTTTAATIMHASVQRQGVELLQLAW